MKTPCFYCQDTGIHQGEPGCRECGQRPCDHCGDVHQHGDLNDAHGDELCDGCYDSRAQAQVEAAMEMG